MPPMPADYRIDRESRRVVSLVRGVYSYDVAVERMRRLQKDPVFESTFSLLIDFREATKIDLSHGEIVELSNIPVFSPESKRAYLVASPEQFGIARMFASYKSPTNKNVFQVFTDIEEAVAWLDSDSTSTPPAGP
jgi:hypothetical protein